MNNQKGQLTLTGLDVLKNYYSEKEPMITHGLFRVQNLGSFSEKIFIKQVSCLSGKNTVPISSYYIYKLPDYTELTPGKIQLQANESVDFEVSFPHFSAVPYLHEEILIELVIGIKEKSISSNCRYKISIRTKKS